MYSVTELISVYDTMCVDSVSICSVMLLFDACIVNYVFLVGRKAQCKLREKGHGESYYWTKCF